MLYFAHGAQSPHPEHTGVVARHSALLMLVRSCCSSTETSLLRENRNRIPNSQPRDRQPGTDVVRREGSNGCVPGQESFWLHRVCPPLGPEARRGGGVAAIPCSFASGSPAPSLHLCPQGILADISFRKLEHAGNGVPRSCFSARQCSVSFPHTAKMYIWRKNCRSSGMAFRVPGL